MIKEVLFLEYFDFDKIKKDMEGCDFIQLDKDNNKINCYINKTDKSPKLIVDFNKMEPLHRALKFWNTYGIYSPKEIVIQTFQKNPNFAKVNVLYDKLYNAEHQLNDIVNNKIKTEMLEDYLKWTITSINHMIMVNKNYSIAMKRLIEQYGLPIDYFGHLTTKKEEEKTL